MTSKSRLNCPNWVPSNQGDASRTIEKGVSGPKKSSSKKAKQLPSMELPPLSAAPSMITPNFQLSTPVTICVSQPVGFSQPLKDSTTTLVPWPFPITEILSTPAHQLKAPASLYRKIIRTLGALVTRERSKTSVSNSSRLLPVA